MQWLAGPPNGLDFLLIEGPVVIGQTRSLQSGRDDQRLIARDAHSGLPLWTRDDLPDNRFSLVLEGGRLYYHFRLGKHQVAAHSLMLDAATGKTLRVRSDRGWLCYGFRCGVINWQCRRGMKT
jgi:hypothetical protein